MMGVIRLDIEGHDYNEVQVRERCSRRLYRGAESGKLFIHPKISCGHIS